jgi:aspartate racemase
MVSLDCDEYVSYLTEDNLPAVKSYLLEGVRRLHAAGASFLVIASNTAHVVAEEVSLTIPSLPVLHIADCIAKEVLAQGFTTVGLLGTEPTMRDGSWLKTRLAAHGVQVVVPSDEEDLHRCYDIICQELSFGVFTAASRLFFLRLAEQLAARGCQGVVLGCTEIELLLPAGDDGGGGRGRRSAARGRRSRPGGADERPAVPERGGAHRGRLCCRLGEEARRGLHAGSGSGRGRGRG